MRFGRSAFAIVIMAVMTAAGAGSPADVSTTPAASQRSNMSNFKDMVFAACIARSQQGQSGADAASSARALVEWTLYDAEQGTSEIDGLITRYLQRDYRNPLRGDEPTSVQFNLLKCLDLYHSSDLALLGKRVVIQTPAAKTRKHH